MSDSTGPDRSRRRIFTGIGVLFAIPLLALAGTGLWGLFRGEARPEGSKAEGETGQAVEIPVRAPGPDQLWVLVSKSNRRVAVLRGTEELKSFPMVLGSEPKGDKEREGDGRTPVGTFYVCEKNAKSKYYLFIGLSYPNEEDAERGLSEGLISRAEHDTIVEAIGEHRKPPWYTRLGGEIGLHGGGTAWDWTEGCIALDNGDMREVYALIRVGATVIIEP